MHLNPTIARGHGKKKKPSDLVWGLLWVAFVVSSMFYVFKSGQPQPSDWIMAFIAGLMFVTGNLATPKKYPAILTAMMWFVGYAILVNTAWFMLTQERDFLIYTAFYIFNLVAVIAFWSLYLKMGKRILTFTAIGVFIAVFLQSALIIFNISISGEVARDVGTFNNPNQLAHFGILMASICTILSRSDQIPRTMAKFFMPLCYLATLHSVNASLSRGGLIAIGLAVVLGLMKNLRMAAIFMIMGAILITSGAYSENMEKAYEKIQRRFRIGNFGMDHDEELLARNGLDRMKNHPQYLIFGAGEGYFRRFESTAGIHYEIHSSAGTIFFSYGIIGVFLVGRIFWPIFKKRKSAVLFVIPMVAFGLTHNGLRQTEVWLIPLIIWITIDSVKWNVMRVKPNPNARMNPQMNPRTPGPPNQPPTFQHN